MQLTGCWEILALGDGILRAHYAGWKLCIEPIPVIALTDLGLRSRSRHDGCLG
jgi:hypothetical protein